MKRTYLVFVIIIFASVGLSAQQLFINEAAPKNNNIICDFEGDTPDWIELYNNEDTDINLKGYSISDSPYDEHNYNLPEIIIPAKGFLVIFASDKNLVHEGEIHTNFKITDDDNIYLKGPEAELIDEFEICEICENRSIGRYPDGSDDIRILHKPSPGYSNRNNTNITFSHDGGYYTEQFNLELEGFNETDSIYYTFDGSLPDMNSYLYSQPILINDRTGMANVFSEIPTTPFDDIDALKKWKQPEGTVDKAVVIRCAAYKNNVIASEVYSRTFFTGENIYDKYKFPVVSIITDSINLFGADSGLYVPGNEYKTGYPWDTGNYFLRGDDWERPVHIEIFDTTGVQCLSQNAGTRIHGGAGRILPQKSLRIYAKDEYGIDEFKYQLLPQLEQGEYKRFIIRSFISSWDWDCMSDIAAQDIVKNMDFDHQSHRPVILFINGEYWGIQNIIERIDKYYLHYKHGVDPDSLDLLDVAFNAEEGDNADFLELLYFVRNNDMSVDDNYNYVSSRIDIPGFIDYNIAEIYLKNFDWPGNNVLIWRPHTPGSKWKWILYDMDAAFGDYNYNMMEHATDDEGPDWPNPPNTTLLFRKLLDNARFREEFIDKFAYHLKTTFYRETVLEKIYYYKYLYYDEIQKHIERWGYPSSFNNWETAVDAGLINFAQYRPCAMQQHIMDFFGLDDFDFDCDSVYTGNTPGPDEPVALLFYPNPASDILNIKLENNVMPYDIIIYNNIGSEVYRLRGINPFKEVFQIRLNHLPQGTYFMRLISSKKVYTKPFVIAR